MSRIERISCVNVALASPLRVLSHAYENYHTGTSGSCLGWEWAVLGSWQLTSPRLSSPVARYFWHQQPSPLRGYFSFSPPQAFYSNHSQTDMGMNAHHACCMPTRIGTLITSTAPGILRGWGRARSSKLRPRVSLPRSPVGHKVLVCTMRRTRIPL